MQIQDKVQNWNQDMTREALILAKANGTLRSLGASDEEIGAIIEKFKEPEADSMGYLTDTLIGCRRRYEPGSAAYAGNRSPDCRLQSGSEQEACRMKY